MGERVLRTDTARVPHLVMPVVLEGLTRYFRATLVEPSGRVLFELVEAFAKPTSHAGTLTETQKLEVVRLRRLGETFSGIARIVGTSEHKVRGLLGERLSQ